MQADYYSFKHVNDGAVRMTLTYKVPCLAPDNHGGVDM